MATRTAQNSGNWSAAGTWDTPPASGDTVELGGYNVTADVDINIGSGTIQNTAGGTLAIPAGTRNITANLLNKGNSQILTVAAGRTVNWTGSLSNTYAGKSAAYVNGGALNVTGNVSNSGGSYARACYLITGTLTVSGDVSNGGTDSRACDVSTGGTLMVTGTVSNSGGGASFAVGTNNNYGRADVGAISAAGRQAISGGCGTIRVRGACAGNVAAGSCSIQIDGAATLGDVSIYNGATLVTLGSFSAVSFSSNACVWYYVDGTTLPPSPGVCFPLPKPDDVRRSATSYFGAYTGTLAPLPRSRQFTGM